MAKGYRNRILVTIGAGFLGSHLYERLLLSELATRGRSEA